MLFATSVLCVGMSCVINREKPAEFDSVQVCNIAITMAVMQTRDELPQITYGRGQCFDSLTKREAYVLTVRTELESQGKTINTYDQGR